MQKYWLQSASQPFSGLPSLVSADRTLSRPPNCLRALKHLFQLALPSWPPDFTFSRCHLHITLNQNPQWAMGRRRKKTRKQARETKPLRFRVRHTGTLWNGDVTRHYRVCVCVCVRWQCACALDGGCGRQCTIEGSACECLCSHDCEELPFAWSSRKLKKIFYGGGGLRQWRDVQRYIQFTLGLSHPTH